MYPAYAPPLRDSDGVRVRDAEEPLDLPGDDLRHHAARRLVQSAGQAPQFRAAVLFIESVAVLERTADGIEPQERPSGLEDVRPDAADLHQHALPSVLERLQHEDEGTGNVGREHRCDDAVHLPLLGAFGEFRRCFGEEPVLFRPEVQPFTSFHGGGHVGERRHRSDVRAVPVRQRIRFDGGVDLRAVAPDERVLARLPYTGPPPLQRPVRPLEILFRDEIEQRPAHHLFRRYAENLDHALVQERRPGVPVDDPDAFGHVLDQTAVPLLAFLELLTGGHAFGHVLRDTVPDDVAVLHMVRRGVEAYPSDTARGAVPDFDARVLVLPAGIGDPLREGGTVLFVHQFHHPVHVRQERCGVDAEHLGDAGTEVFQPVLPLRGAAELVEGEGDAGEQFFVFAVLFREGRCVAPVRRDVVQRAEDGAGDVITGEAEVRRQRVSADGDERNGVERGELTVGISPCGGEEGAVGWFDEGPEGPFGERCGRDAETAA